MGKNKNKIRNILNADYCLLATFRSILATVFWLLATCFTLAQGPAWWLSRGAVDTNLTARDYGPITLGQLKWIATNACDEMNACFDAGSNVISVVSAFASSNNYYLANIGQLKYVAQPFYDRLYALNLTNTFPANMPGYYPWGNSSSTNDYAFAAIGQAKYVFSFDSAVDSDGDGLSDWREAGIGSSPYDTDSDDDGMPDGWEFEHGLNPTVNDADGDHDGDGVSNLTEYLQGRDAAAGVTGDTNGVVNLKVFTTLE